MDDCAGRHVIMMKGFLGLKARGVDFIGITPGLSLVISNYVFLPWMRDLGSMEHQ